MKANSLDLSLLRSRILAVAVIERVADAVPLGRALLAGGLDVLEVTLRTEAAVEAICVLRRELPEMRIGAGTVLDPEAVPRLVGAGVSFAVSPGLSPAVFEACAKAGLPLVPGVMTPTEVERAMGLGARVLKFFPAEAAGGVAYLKALSAPYAHTGVRFVPTGGVNAGNLGAYLGLGTVAACGGSWFVDPGWIRAGDFDRVRRATAEALAVAAAGCGGAKL